MYSERGPCLLLFLSIMFKYKLTLVVYSGLSAKDFYNKLASGGLEKRVNGNMKITRMSDGTVITMRRVSYSDGTPVVDINIKPSSHTGGVKGQKIHFVLEK